MTATNEQLEEALRNLLKTSWRVAWDEAPGGEESDAYSEARKQAYALLGEEDHDATL